MAAVACGSSDSANSSGGVADTQDGGPPGLSGVPDGTFEISIDDPSTVRMITQGQTFDLTVHVKRGAGIGTIKLTVDGLPKDAVAAPVTVLETATDAKVSIVSAATTPQGPASLKVRASVESHADVTTSFNAFVRGAPGSLDTTFASTGYLSAPYTAGGDGNDVVVLPDGSALFGDPLVKIKSDGVVDTTFGNNGLGVGTPNGPFVTDGSGRIYWMTANSAANLSDARLKRTLANGQPDTLFSSDVAIHHSVDDARVVVAGNKTRVIQAPYLSVGGGSIYVFQFNDDGSQDSTWGTAFGSLSARCSPSNMDITGDIAVRKYVHIRAWALSSGETPMMTGVEKDNGDVHFTSLVTCAADGKSSASVRLDIVPRFLDAVRSGANYAVLVQAPCAANTSNACWTTVSGTDATHATNIGNNGYVDAQMADATQILEQPDGKILIGGRSGAAGALDVTLTRFLPNGEIDKAFGNQGKVVTRVSDGSNDMRFGRMALGPDGRIYVAASHFDVDNGAFIRYWN